MKKEDLVSSIVYLAMLGIALLVGIYVIQPNIQEIATSLSWDNGSVIWFVFICLVVGIILNIIFIELGHVIGAKIGKYNVYSISIAGLTWYKVKEEEKFKTKFGIKSFDGLTGETKIYPKTEKSNPIPFIIGPFVLILLEFFALFLSMAYIKDSSNVVFIKYGLIMISTVGGLFCLYDYIPTKLDSETDGYRWTLLAKKINIEALNEKLRVESRLYFKEELGDVKLFDQITDFTAIVNNISIYKLIEEEKYDEALKIEEDILNTEKISNDTKNLAANNKLFILLLKDPTSGLDYYNTLSDREVKFIKFNKGLENIRTFRLYIYLKENSELEDKELVEKYNKVYKSELSGLKIKEKELFDLVDKIKEKYKKEEK